MAVPLSARLAPAGAATMAHQLLQPPPAQVAGALDAAAQDALPAGYPRLDSVATIPAVLLKAIAWLESGWRQFRVPDVPLTSTGGGYGVMQLTRGMGGTPVSPTVQSAIANNFVYNIACGAQLLSDKWSAVPPIGSGDPAILEDWYYAVWAYNAWGWRNNPNNAVFTRHGTPLTNPSAFPYQERVFYLAGHPPLGADGAPLWPAVAVTLPRRALIGKHPGALPAPTRPHYDVAPHDPPLQLSTGDDVQLQSDPSVSDTTSVAPGTAAHKVVVLRNAGGAFWSGYSWRFVGGDRAQAPLSLTVPYAPPLADVALGVDMVAPSQAGTYTGYWQLYDATGTAVGPRAALSLSVALPATAAATMTPTATPPMAATATPVTTTPTATPVTATASLASFTTTVTTDATTAVDATNDVVPAATPPSAGNPKPSDAGSDDASYVADVTVPDGTVLTPGQPFTKTWEIQNTGTRPWTPQYHWTFEAGAPMGIVRSVAAAAVPRGGTATFSVQMVAPTRPGTYRGYWQMSDAAGNVFGSQAWVIVRVETAPAATALAASPTPGVVIPTVLPQPALSPTPTVTPRPTATARPPSVPWFGPAVSRAFFAEGYTGPGYQEYLTVLNPRPHALRAQLTIYRADGATLAVPLRLGSLTRRTLNLNLLVPRASIALAVQADGPAVVERALYTANGHIVAGAPLPSRHWYLAEGYVGAGFRDGLRLFNPGAVAASITIKAYRGDGSTVLSHRVVPGETRLNVALDDVARHGPSSLDVDSSVPVVVEDVVRGLGTSGPAAAMALAAPARQWYFPDGSSATGNREYVAVFNPGSATATARLVVVTSDGYQRPFTLHVRAHSRAVFVVHGLIHRSGLAATVAADRPIVAQETRYTSTGGLSLVDGAAAPARRWGFAEGYVGHGYKQWITLLNPGTRPATATVELLASHGYRYKAVMYERPHHRDYLYVNDLVPVGQVAAIVTANRPIVAGRTMIFNDDKGLSTTTGVALLTSS